MMMMVMAGVLQLVIFLGWALALLLGCIMAFRGRRWWATFTMLCGVIMQVSGFVGVVVPGFLMSSRGSSSFDMMQMVMIVCALAIALGFLLFGIGFVGFCARYGATESRAAELEGMVQVLQDRMGEQQQ